MREEKLFNDSWLFCLDDRKNMAEADYDDSDWERVSLPHDFAGHAVFHQQGRQVAAELGGFFFQGHAGEQVLHPEGDGLSFVLIEHGITSL